MSVDTFCSALSSPEPSDVLSTLTLTSINTWKRILFSLLLSLNVFTLLLSLNVHSRGEHCGKMFRILAAHAMFNYRNFILLQEFYPITGILSYYRNFILFSAMARGAPGSCRTVGMCHGRSEGIEWPTGRAQPDTGPPQGGQVKDSVWRKGQVKDSVWHKGQVKDSVWRKGQVKDSVWRKGQVKDSVWRKGQVKDSVWRKGQVKDSVWCKGQVKDSVWCKGQVKDSVWRKGQVKDSVWCKGQVKDSVWRLKSF